MSEQIEQDEFLLTIQQLDLTDEQKEGLLAAYQIKLADLSAEAKLLKIATPRTFAESLSNALLVEIKGRNKATIEIINQDDDARRVVGQALASCPGVTVDLDAFQLALPIAQLVLRAYNRPEVKKLSDSYDEEN